jgi:very-short-patch-repair endonuclease/predicted transcriptional regulator of viral defense system
MLEVAESRPEAWVLAAAARQHGLVTTAQLLGAGWSKDVVAAHVRSGWLRRRHRGVYLVGPLDTPHTRAMAATLAAGPGALLSHYPAAVLWGLRPPTDGPMHVTRPAGAHSRPGIIVHRAALHPADATHRHGIPVTSAARTLLDLAAATTLDELDRAVNEARVNRVVSDHALSEQFSRYPRHRGTVALKEVQRTEPKLTRSEAERLALDLIRKAGLPAPEVNSPLHGYEVDLLWRDARLVVEIDGYAFHSSRRSFENDRRRDQHLAALGYRVIRVTWRQLTEEREAVVATITRALAERR